ncbi:MAG: hypothetical protein BM564_07365 [Bacteroidetes bacterium MedPE-SWsnd-G2]|nr:MAG: hypothetical protein BM564_07365 [Bacteroidetes bacterium MedPE-SWsnd-G2]
MKHFASLLFLFFTVITANAQLTGKVTDTNNTPLAFVNIFVENTFTGTTSNENGLYELNLETPKTYTIVFQYLGFKTVKKELVIDHFPFQFDMVLTEEEVALNEVVINSEENPAHSIVRNAIKKRKDNLKKIDDYTADFYCRGLIKIKDAPEKLLGQDVGDLGGGLDSTRTGVIYLSETISKIEFLRPDNLKETIIASKVSGNDNGFSFNNAGDNEFNFYKNTVEIGNALISPIADYAFNYYKYNLDGVFYDDKGHLINKIKVTPKRVKDHVFSGYIYIVEDQWSIYALELEVTGEQIKIPAAKVVKLKQNFSYSETQELWAIISQEIDFSYDLFGVKGDGRFTAIYSNYQFNNGLNSKQFTNEILSFNQDANKKDSTFWNTIRPVPLTNEEVSDYIKKDKLQELKKSIPYLDSVDHVKNKFQIKDILFGYAFQNSFKSYEINISSPLKDFNFNTVQGFNSSLELRFRKEYNDYKKYLDTKVSINYGESDDRLRYKGQLSYKFNNISKPILTVSAGVETQQFNGANPISPLVNSIATLFFEKNFIKLYEKSHASLDFTQELFNGVRIWTGVNYELRKSLFNTTDQTFFNDNNRSYSSNNPLNPNVANTSAFTNHHIIRYYLNTRINFGQTYFSYPDSKVNLRNDKYPTVYIGYEAGFGATVSDYNFNQLKLRVSQFTDIGNLGRLGYNLRLGTFINPESIAFMDYQHFNGNQTHYTNESYYTNRFNNLEYYRLSTNDSYSEFHAEHHFQGLILGKIPGLNLLNFNLVAGFHNLSTSDHKPYQEYNIGLENIGWGKFRFLRVDYIRSYQGGFQGDAFLFGLNIF